MARQLIWSPRAIRQIDDLADYIAKSSGHYPAIVVKRIFGRMASVPDQPGQGRRVPEYDGPREYREVFVHSWRIIYRVDAESLVVVAVVHGARLLKNVDLFEG